MSNERTLKNCVVLAHAAASAPKICCLYLPKILLSLLSLFLLIRLTINTIISEMSTPARLTSGAAMSANSTTASKNSAAASAKSAAQAAAAAAYVATLVAQQGELFVCVGWYATPFRFVPCTFSHTKYARSNRPTGCSTAATSGVESVAFYRRHLECREYEWCRKGQVHYHHDGRYVCYVIWY